MPQGGPRKGQSKGATAQRLGPRAGGEATAGGVKGGEVALPSAQGCPLPVHSPHVAPGKPRTLLQALLGTHCAPRGR